MEALEALPMKSTAVIVEVQVFPFVDPCYYTNIARPKPHSIKGRIRPSNSPVVRTKYPPVTDIEWAFSTRLVHNDSVTV